LAGNDFNLPWRTNDVPFADRVNNVENVYIPTPLGSNYTITVSAQRVNVNAVRQHTNDIVQDYALVISSGNGEVTNAFTLTEFPLVVTNLPEVTIITNVFGVTNGYSGGILSNQRVGANSPLLGTNSVALSNSVDMLPNNGLITLGQNCQWRFYVITNINGYTNGV